jgi:AraC-like DNA-binding protein
MLNLPRSATDDHPQITMALDCMLMHDPSCTPDLRQLASSMNLSTSYFRHLFKQSTGLSFARYLKARRLQQARKFLQEKPWSVKQAMFTAGLKDHSHFARDYKQAFGESPSQTRRLSFREHTGTRY